MNPCTYILNYIYCHNIKSISNFHLIRQHIYLIYMHALNPKYIIRRIIISECRTWNLLLRRPMLFWSSFLFVHRHYWTSPVNHPQDIPTKELQSLYIFTMSVTHCDRGKGGAPPRPLRPSGPFASLRSSANFCMASLHIVLHFSLNCSLCVTNSIYLFNNIQANSLFLLICKGIWKLTL